MLDTNHVRYALDAGSPVAQRILTARLSGDRFGICLPVLCEIEAGIPRLEKPQKYRQVLTHAMQSWSVWPMDSRTAGIYGQLYDTLRAAGRVLSQVDLMLAAICLQSDIVLLTSDRDFEAIPSLRFENWHAG